MARKLLVVGAESVALQRVIPILLRAEFELCRTMSGVEAVDLLRLARFDLVLVRLPLVGVKTPDLVAAVRGQHSPSRAASLLLLAEPAAAEEVGPLLGHGVNRIVSLDAPSDRLFHAVGDLIGVPPRKTLRAVVQLETRVEAGGTRVLTMTQNVSANGMLLRGGMEFPIGSRLRFEMVLPGEHDPVAGEVEVVRQAPATDHVAAGIGARILDFSESDRERFEAFLRPRTA
ncbi:MAG: hypothetical protein GW878_00640 [Acidobacteria bacterium]|nr:hypothetical protein [Acidobacteriota bacterium]